MKILKVGQSKTTFRVIRNMRRKVRVKKLGRGKYSVRVKRRLTPEAKKKSAYYGYGDKPQSRYYTRDRPRIHEVEEWERRHRLYPIRKRR